MRSQTSMYLSKRRAEKRRELLSDIVYATISALSALAVVGVVLGFLVFGFAGTP